MKRYLRTLHLLLWLLPCSSTFALSENSMISEWLILGSFQSDTIHTALDTPYLSDEISIMPEKGMSSGPYTWQSAETNKNGELNFIQQNLPYTAYCVAYAAAYIFSPEERNVLLLTGSNDAVALWLNDKQVHHNLTYRLLKRGEDKVPVRLAKGWNRLLAKVVNTEGGFGLSVDIVDMDKNELDDIITSVRKPEEMVITSSSPYAYIDKIYLAPGKAKGSQRIYPLVISVKNLGKKGKYDTKALLDIRGLATRTERFNLDQTGKAVFSLASHNVERLLNRGGGVRILLNGRMHDFQIINLSPEMVLKSIFESDQLPTEAKVVHKMYMDLNENMYWYQKFTDKTLDTKDKTLSQIVQYGLRNEWDNFFKALETSFIELKEFSTIIKQDTLHMIGQSHIDMAWLWPWKETIDVCRRTFQSAINFFETEPDFKYIQSQAAAFEWMEQYEPELFKAIQKAVQDKRFFLVGGMWVEPDLNLIGGEALIRQFLYGKRYFKEKFGVDCITGYTPDTFGYAWSLPQILKKSGFKYFVTTKIRWNDTTDFPYSLFHWVSPDGSDILTCFPMALNSKCELDNIANHIKTFKKEKLVDLPVLYGVGDHGGGPTREHFKNIKKMQSLAAYPTAYYDDLDSYMNRVAVKYPDVPTYKDELYLEFHRGTLTTQGKVKKQNRQSEIALETAEKFTVFSDMEYPKAKLDSAWKLTLFNQFHDILPGSSIPRVYLDADKDYAKISELTQYITSSALQKIASEINLKDKDIPVVVFNTLSWERSGIVNVKLKNTNIKEIKDCNGEKTDFQQQDSVLCFYASDIPACGYKTFWLKTGKTKEQKNSLQVTETALENSFYKIEINPGNGNIRHFYDKINKRDVLEAGKEGNVLEFLQDIPDKYDAWNIGYTGKSWICEQVERVEIVEQGPVKAVLRYVRLFGKSKFTQDYILYADIPRLDIRTTADWHEEHILLKASFPVNVNADYATYDMAYGSIQRTTHPQTPAEKAKFEVPAHKYADLSEEQYGVTLMNDCKYGHDVNDNVMRLTLLRSPQTPMPHKRPDNYVAPFADQGKHEFNYSIYPHAGDMKKAASIRQSFQFNYPLLSVATDRHKGERKQSNSFLKVSAENVVVTAVKKAEDSQASIVRLYETFGDSSQVTLEWMQPVKQAWLTDMQENRISEIQTKGKNLTFAIKPNEIITLMIE